MKLMKQIVLVMAVGAVALGMAGCNNKSDSKTQSSPITGEVKLGEASEQAYQQVERLARPGINEALVLTNANLNLWNSLPPSADGTAATAGIIGEVVAVQTALINLGAGGPPVSTVASMFLPDVMRIDVSKTVAPGAVAYNSCQGAAGKPLCGGRKITDDIADITLSFLGASDPTGNTVKDNVAYNDHHQPVLGSFPYLASPN
jgi:hypothetical protein